MSLAFLVPDKIMVYGMNNFNRENELTFFPGDMTAIINFAILKIIRCIY
jgi:hypothetical protein